MILRYMIGTELQNPALINSKKNTNNAFTKFKRIRQDSTSYHKRIQHIDSSQGISINCKEHIKVLDFILHNIM
jgi:hypothetical protein